MSKNPGVKIQSIIDISKKIIRSLADRDPSLWPRKIRTKFVIIAQAILLVSDFWDTHYSDGPKIRPLGARDLFFSQKDHHGLNFHAK